MYISMPNWLYSYTSRIRHKAISFTFGFEYLPWHGGWILISANSLGSHVIK